MFKNTLSSWKSGWLLLKASWSTIKAHKAIMLYQLYAGALTVLCIICLIAVSFRVYTIPSIQTYFSGKYLAWPLLLLGLFLFYFITYSIVNYFSAALIAYTLEVFRGGQPTIRFGLQQAYAHRRSLLQFTAIQSTIGTVVQVSEDRLPLGGALAMALADIAWKLASLFALPVIMSSSKPLGPIATIRQSADMFKKTWGQNLTGDLAITALFLFGWFIWFMSLIGAVVLAAAIGLGTLYVTVPILAFTMLAGLIVMGTINGIFLSALYHFATTQQSPVQFNQEMLRAAFKPKTSWFI